MRIIINRSLYDGNGLCVQQAPQLLMLDQNDSPQLVQERVDAAERGAAEKAVQACPKAALRLGD
jgi:ferredoxin